MKLALLLALSLTGWGQITITGSLQDPVIPKAYVGTDIPKSLGLYLIGASNDGPAATSVYVDRIALEVSKVAPVQDGEAVIYAAQHLKKNGWKVWVVRGIIYALPIGGAVVAGLKAATDVGKALAGVGGIAGVQAAAKATQNELEHLDIPLNFWRPDPITSKTLQPGQAYFMLMVLGGDPGPMFGRQISAVQIAKEEHEANPSDETRRALILAVRRSEDGL